jgi:hypothetical protein
MGSSLRRGAGPIVIPTSASRVRFTGLAPESVDFCIAIDNLRIRRQKMDSVPKEFSATVSLAIGVSCFAALLIQNRSSELSRRR